MYFYNEEFGHKNVRENYYRMWSQHDDTYYNYIVKYPEDNFYRYFISFDYIKDVLNYRPQFYMKLKYMNDCRGNLKLLSQFSKVECDERKHKYEIKRT